MAAELGRFLVRAQDDRHRVPADRRADLVLELAVAAATSLPARAGSCCDTASSPRNGGIAPVRSASSRSLPSRNCARSAPCVLHNRCAANPSIPGSRRDRDRSTAWRSPKRALHGHSRDSRIGRGLVSTSGCNISSSLAFDSSFFSSTSSATLRPVRQRFLRNLRRVRVADVRIECRHDADRVLDDRAEPLAVRRDAVHAARREGQAAVAQVRRALEQAVRDDRLERIELQLTGFGGER